MNAMAGLIALLFRGKAGLVDFLKAEKRSSFRGAKSANSAAT